MTEVIYTHGVTITVHRHVELARLLSFMALGWKAIRLLEGTRGVDGLV